LLTDDGRGDYRRYACAVIAAGMWVLALALDAGAGASAGAAAAAPALVPPPAAAGSLLTRARAAAVWGARRVPSTGAAQAIGSCSCGCLQGGATLPVSGRGYEVVRVGRNRRYGHPQLVAFVRRLGASAARGKLGLLMVGDLSQPRGGPTPSGHRSHQSGLDADIGYVAPAGLRAGRVSARDRENLWPLAVVDVKTHAATPAWGPRVVKLIGVAASDRSVDRIFVNPAIKKMLCTGATAKAPWQRRVRPWWGHHDHFHVRLRCPTDSPLCVPQEPPPDDGCGASLAWWFAGDAETKRTKKKDADATEPAAFVLPEACAALTVD
jgi:penicillin-insensitive murein endopeptidase